MSSSFRLWLADHFTDEKARTLSLQVSILGDMVWELENKITQLHDEKGKLEKQLAETKEAAQAISRQKEEMESSLKGENTTLGLEVSAVEEKYRQSKAELEMLQMKLGALEKEKEEAVKAFDDEKDKMMMESKDLKRRLEEVLTNKDLVESDNDKLRSEALIAEQKQIKFEAEIERLKMELGALTEAKEAAAKAFQTQNEEMEDLKRKFEEIHTNKDLVESENDKLRSVVSAVEEKYRQSKAELEMLQMKLGALVKEKEEAVKAFDDEKEKMMMESKDLKSRLEEILTNKDLVESDNDKLRSEASITEQKQIKFEAEIERLKMELGALTEAKEAAAKAFETQNEEMEDLKRKFEEIQTNKDLVESENDKLRSVVSAVEEKYRQSEWLNNVLRVVVKRNEEAAKACEAEKVEILKESGNLKRRIEEIQASKDLVKSENGVLRSDILTMKLKNSEFEQEIKTIKNELEASEQEKEATTKIFDVEKAKILKELEDLKRNVQEIQTEKDLVEAENDKLRSEASTAKQRQHICETYVDALVEATTKAFDAEKKELEVLKKRMEEVQASKDKLQLAIFSAQQKHIHCELEVRRLKVELDALAEAKETAIKSFDAEKAKFMKEVEDLKWKVEEIRVSMDAEADRRRAKLVKIRVSQSQLQASYNELDAKHSRLNDEKNSVQNALDAEKVEAWKLKSKVEELENYNSEKDGETEKLKAELEEKKSKIDALIKDNELLQRAVAEA